MTSISDHEAGQLVEKVDQIEKKVDEIASEQKVQRSLINRGKGIIAGILMTAGAAWTLIAELLQNKGGH